VIREIETGLDGQMQIALGEIVERGLADELRLAGLTKRV
jgi:hypothetical protein